MAQAGMTLSSITAILRDRSLHHHDKTEEDSCHQPRALRDPFPDELTGA